MKTLHSSNQIARRAGLVLVVFSLFLGGSVSARAQALVAECAEEVLSAPTESSMSVRLTGVNQWPVTPICFWSANGVRADGQTYNWQAVLIGDGLLDPPDSVNVSVQFRYTGPSGCSSLSLNFFPPHPSAAFTNLVTSDGASLDPTCGQDGPPLSFQGSLSLDASNNFTVDITFTGGTVAPRLRIAAEGTNVVVTWSRTFTDFMLETTGALSSASTWSTVMTTPTVAGGEQSVTLPASADARFYRLRSQ